MGGVAGQAINTLLDGATVDATIVGNNQVGGIAGNLSVGFVFDVGFIGDVSGVNYVGGVAGVQIGGEIRSSFARVRATATTGPVGGLVGYLDNGIIEDSYARGAITSQGPAGGLIGEAEPGDLSAVRRSYSATTRGGLVGTGTLNTTLQSFWDAELSGADDPTPNDPSNGSGLPTTTMQRTNTYQNADWSIAAPFTPSYSDALWGHCDNNGYPYLRWVWEQPTIASALEAAGEPRPRCLWISDDAALASISTSHGTLTPPFDPDYLAYQITLPYSQTDLTITATVREGAARVSIDSGPASTSATSSYTLAVATPTTATLIVTAEDGSQRTYTVTLTRAAAIIPAPTIDHAIPDDASAWLIYTLPTGATGLDYRVDESEWITFSGSGPLQITGLTNDVPVTLQIRALTPEGLSLPSEALTLTPTGPQAVPITMLLDEANSRVERGTDTTALTLTFILSNEGPDPINGAWLDISNDLGSVTDVDIMSSAGSALALNGKWYLANLNLLPAETMSLRVTVIAEVP